MSEYRHLEDQIFDENLILERIGYKLSRILAGSKAFRKLFKEYGDGKPLMALKDPVDGIIKYIERGDFELSDWGLTVYMNDTLKPSQILFEAEKVERVKRYITDGNK